MIKTNASRVFVLFFAYISVFLCDFIESYYIYYTSLIFSCFTLIIICTSLKDDKLLFFYAVIQFIAMTGYYLMQTDLEWIARIALYDGIFSIKNVMMAYELFIISYTGVNLVNFIVDGFYNANNITDTFNKIN
jgi:hypothetical protein